jgi:hypothetical protein
MRSRTPLAAAALAVVALAGCQSPDVGGECTLAWNATWEQDGTTAPPAAAQLYASGGSDYFESGNLACDGLVCLVSPAPEGAKYGSDGRVYGSTTPGLGYCSKPCVSNSDCYEKETGLVCRQMVLDPVFLDQLDPETRSRYLADIQYSSYCSVPR